MRNGAFLCFIALIVGAVAISVDTVPPTPVFPTQYVRTMVSYEGKSKTFITEYYDYKEFQIRLDFVLGPGNATSVVQINNFLIGTRYQYIVSADLCQTIPIDGEPLAPTFLKSAFYEGTRRINNEECNVWKLPSNGFLYIVTQTLPYKLLRIEKARDCFIDITSITTIVPPNTFTPPKDCLSKK